MGPPGGGGGGGGGGLNRKQYFLKTNAYITNVLKAILF